MKSSNFPVGTQLRRVLFPVTDEPAEATKPVTDMAASHRRALDSRGGSLATLVTKKRRGKRQKDVSKSRVTTSTESVLVDLRASVTSSRVVEAPQPLSEGGGLLSLFSMASERTKPDSAEVQNGNSGSGIVLANLRGQTLGTNSILHSGKSNCNSKQARISKKKRNVKFSLEDSRTCRSSRMSELVVAFPPTGVSVKSRRARVTQEEASARELAPGTEVTKEGPLAMDTGEGLVPRKEQIRPGKRHRRGPVREALLSSPSPAKPVRKRVNMNATPKKEQPEVDPILVQAVMGSGESTMRKASVEPAPNKTSKRVVQRMFREIAKGKTEESIPGSKVLDFVEVVPSKTTRLSKGKAKAVAQVEETKRRSTRRQTKTDRYSPEVVEEMETTQRQEEKRKKQAQKAKRDKAIVAEPDKAKSVATPAKEPSLSVGEYHCVDEEPEPRGELATHSQKDSAQPLPAAYPSSGNSHGDLGNTLEWTQSQLYALKQSQADVDPMSSSFWAEVASNVVGKGASECREKWFSLVKTPAAKLKKGAKEKPQCLPGPAEQLSAAPTPSADDIFNSTPMRETLLRGADHPSSKENLKPKSTNVAGADMGSPIVVLENSSKANSTKHSNNAVARAPAAKPGYKTYLLGLKRGLSKAVKERRGKRQAKQKVVHRSHDVSEYAGSGEVEINGHLTPGGTLNVKNFMGDDDEDDFFEEMYDA